MTSPSSRCSKCGDIPFFRFDCERRTCICDRSDRKAGLATCLGRRGQLRRHEIVKEIDQARQGVGGDHDAQQRVKASADWQTTQRLPAVGMDPCRVHVSGAELSGLAAWPECMQLQRCWWRHCLRRHLTIVLHPAVASQAIRPPHISATLSNG